MRLNFTKQFLSPKTQAEYRRILKPFKGKARVNYLEVGVFQGHSLTWMFREILTHPSCKATAVDPFYNGTETLFKANIRAAGLRQRVKLFKVPSQEILGSFRKSSFDVIYIDGGHLMQNVLSDIVLSWPLLKIGGILLLDDYLLRAGTTPIDLRPQAAIDAFLTAYRDEFELIQKGEFIAVKKVHSVIPRLDTISQFSDFIFDWQNQSLSRGIGEVKLTQQEVRSLKKILCSLELGQSDLNLESALWKSGGIKKLMRKLGIMPQDFLRRSTQSSRFNV